MKILLIISVLIVWTKTLADQSPGPGPEYADVVFLVDSSDHLGTKSFPFVRTFISRMINSLPIEASKYRVALAQYSDSFYNEFQLNTFKSRNPMLNHLKKNFMFQGGSLRIGNALWEAHRTYFSRPTISRDKKQFPPILVVLASAESEDDVEEAAKALREDGVRIVSVGMQRASEENLRAMATGQFHFNLRTIRDLSTFSQNMTQIIKEAAQYREGTDEADVKAPIPVTCQKDSLADLVFLVDESVGSIHNLRDLQRFLRNITSSVDVKDNCVRLGLMRYGETAETISFLNSSKTQSEFQQQIQKLSFRTGKSNAGAAIEKLRQEGFSEAGGSRRAQGVPQIAVLITSRASDDQVRDAALSLRLEGTTVFTMNIQGANNTQLEEIASYPPEQTISKLKSYADLAGYSKNFLKKFQNEIWSQISTHAEQMELDKTGCVDTKEADIYFLIDGSTSIQRRNFEQIKDFMSAVIEMFRIGPDKVQIGVVQYSNRVEVEFASNVYSNAVDLKKAVFNIKQLQGETLTGAALHFMLSEIQEGRKQRASQVPCYLIVLTDGKSMDRVLEPAERLRAEHITIYAVGIGEANKMELQQIAGKEERVYFGNNFDALKSIKRDVIHDICTEKGCEDMKTDIMFLVDSSGSIGPENFEKMKSFMKNLSAKLQIGADKIQIGVVQFSGDTKEEFQLDKYFTQKEILDAIDRLYLIGQNTLTGKALNFVPQYFTSSKGARFEVRKFLILITDGAAQDDVRDPAKALRDRGVIIFSVGVYGANRTQLEEISGDSSQVFQVENFDHLKAIENKLIFHMCAVHDCKRIELLDVVFVLDHSGSIHPQQQESMIDLAVRLVNKTHVGSDQVQFGALRYSDHPEVLFYLNTYSTKQAIRENLRMRRSTGGSTYTARALEFSNNLFTEEHGSRIKKNVKQMLIVITDGESHDREMLNEAASKLRDKGIIIYAVGVGKANQNELEIIAGNKNNTIHVDDFDKLKDVYHTLQESMCNNSQEVCNIPKADVIFLCDSSSRVSDSEFVTMTTFLSDLSDNFDIQSQKIKLGLAQFGSIYKELVGLSDSLTKSQWKNQIQTIKKINGSPQVDHALSKVKFMFDPSVGGRRNAGVPQTLVVILSGPPQGNVSEAVKDLRDLGICVLAWGVGDVQKQQLLSITDNPGKIVTFQDFTKLKDMDVRKRMVREICQSCGKTNCFVDIVVGFDISTHLPGQRLFHGHSPLESYLPGILEDITSIRGVSCGAGAETQVSVAFKVNSEENFPAKFQIYQKAMFGSLLQPLTVNGSSQLNAQFLQWLWDTFESRDTAQVQVLLIFSDGIGGQSITLLEDKSDRLREAGLDALLVVSLDPAAHDQFSSFEFGKGFDYRTHLTIGMRELGGLLSQYLGNIAERTCCCTFCKCTGPPGPPGAPGVANVKGSPGLKGSRGHRGEDGDPGTRGEKGLPGEKGTAGCPGERGQKGAQGFCGQEGEHGEDGIDGVNGEEGIHGSPGEKGENGDPGSQGSPGIRGSPGEYGKKGFSGDPGIPGINSNIKGQKGFKGGQGRQGRTGQNGMKGSPGPKGSRGREGQRGVRGLPGVPGIPGPKGELGPEGLQGPQGRRGLPGRKGEKGSHGPVGPQGSSGPMGAKGNHGRPGPLGRKGEPGFSGDRGQVGQAGQRGKQGDNGIPGYGQMGRKGIKGPRGFLGDMGQKGNVGDPGIPGSPGPKGFKGLSAFEGLKGEAGSRGPPGPPGRRGVKGMAGLPVYSQCDLIQFMRDHSPCWKKKCPVYPTELVFALDQSYDITEQRFNAMVDIMHSIINNLHIMENNCPVGARVAVTAYDSHAWYLIRWFDYHNKKQLLQLLSQINYQPPTAPQDIGNAMRFVARNVFKRTYAGPNVRRVAVFFSNRQAASLSSIITATMEFSAWDISPAVIAFNERVFLDEAFEFDNTGTFQVIPIPPYGQSESEQIERLWNCTLCYDKCFPNVCAKEIILPEDSYMDVALLLENSQYIVNDELQALKTLVSSMLDSFNIASAPLSSNGDRIALLSYSPWDSSIRRGAVKTEFDFTAYSDKLLMKNYIQTHLQQLSGEATISDSLKWTIENLFPRTPNLRRHKVIFVVSAGENYEKRHFLERIALRAKCQGFVIVVISLGPTHKDHLEELASDPRDHHLIRLGRIHKPDLDYIVKSLKPVVYSIRRGLNQYPSQMLKNICRHIHTEEEDYPLFTPKPQEIALGENRFIEQEFSARRDSPLVLEDNGSDHLVYLPNHMVMPQELMINYEKVQDSEEVASLTSDGEDVRLP
ncbi:collagen alpha-5(VI) chain isoform X2 [Talpa occidentalis]|uniref:collagen alpha-5(VI) chain isoform X2 n=1 Tax=Talpa occidentalis TaxID=50954 RepID=UPI00188ECBDA|nr:collagen alpha-5(VI) chain isoform X2 [Talpa occidentalis]